MLSQLPQGHAQFEANVDERDFVRRPPDPLITHGAEPSQAPVAGRLPGGTG